MAVAVDSKILLAYLSDLELHLTGPMMAQFLDREVGEYLRKRAESRFASEGDDVSGAWAPLRPATQAIRGANPEWPVGPAHPINKRTGELEDWVTRSPWAATETGPDSAALVYPATRPSGELKQKVLTAQKGRDNPRTVPRPVLGVNQADMMFVITRLVFHLGSLGPSV